VAKKEQERMTEMQCPHCGTLVEPSAKRCPACRRRLPSSDKETTPARWPFWLIAALAVCLVLAGLVTAGMIVSRRAAPNQPIVTVPRPPGGSAVEKPLIAGSIPDQPPTDQSPNNKTSPPPSSQTETSKGHQYTAKSKPNDALNKLLPDPGTKITGVLKELDIFGAIRDRNDAKVENMLAVHPELANARNYKGATPLHLAAALGDEELAARLIVCGADVNAKCDQQMLAGQTPLHIAAGRNETGIMRLLLAKNARVNAKDALGGTPLHEAAAHGSLEAASLLLQSGAALEARQNDGQTPLFWTAVGGNPAVTRLLLDHGAEINTHDYSELTPLTFAEAMDCKAVVDLLRKRGAKE